jgi:hypothetical protein
LQLTSWGQPRYRLCPGGGPTAQPWVRGSLRAWWVGFLLPTHRVGAVASGGNPLGVVSVEPAVVIPDGPRDAGELVGQSDRGPIRVGFSGLLEGPGLELGDGLACHLGAARGEKGGAGAVNEEHANVGVALFADASESLAPSGGVLARGEPEPAGDLAAALEGMDVGDGGVEGGGREDSDPGDLEQRLDDGLLPGQLVKLGFHRFGASLEVPHLLEERQDGPAHAGRQTDLVILEEGVEVTQESLRSRGHGDAELPEERAHGIDPGGPGGHPLGTDPVERDQGLLVLTLDGDGVDPGAAVGLEEGLTIGSIGLVPSGRIRERKRLSRPQFDRFWDRQAPCRVVMEGCATSHFWARSLIARGFEVTLLPPHYVKPYRRPGTEAEQMALGRACVEAKNALRRDAVFPQERQTSPDRDDRSVRCIKS